MQIKNGLRGVDGPLVSRRARLRDDRGLLRCVAMHRRDGGGAVRCWVELETEDEISILELTLTTT